MDAFIYKLAVIFIPGIMGRFLLARLLFIKNNDKFYFILSAFLIALPSYLIFDLFTFAFIPDTSLFSGVADVFNLASAAPIKVSTIVAVTFISLCLSTILAFLETKRCLTHISQTIGITTRESGADVWNDLFNSRALQEDPWLVVRDRKNDLSYQGRLRRFSDLATFPELYLDNVIVYKGTTGEKLYEVNALYLALEPERIEIECLPNRSQTTEKACAIIEKIEEEGGLQ